MNLVVVGGGPAGTAAALQGRELGAEVTLVEADQIGGTSLNRGPAPVRTLARAARLARDWSSWKTFGLEGPSPAPNLAAMLANSARVARYAHEKKHMADHLRHHGIDLFEQVGPVAFVDAHTIRADDGRAWRGERIIIAVGGHAATLPVPGGSLALTYEDVHTSPFFQPRSRSSAGPTPAARSALFSATSVSA
jgi:pyruvate/2-oxoglutarate dehydrogenase complex dihydrolipoamide dehydrogenase (E3) component